MEGLGQEALDAPGPVHGELILMAQLVHAQHGYDILKLTVFLQYLLDGPGGLVMLVAHDIRLQHTGRGGQGVHSRVNTQLGDSTGQHGGGVQVGKGGGRGRVGEVVGRHVHGLDGGDGALAGGDDTLLQRAHLRGQGGLIAHGGGHVAQQGGHLGTRLDKAENVVYNQQHVLMLHVSEVFGNGQGGEGHPKSGAGGLVHLSVDQGGFLHHAGLGHLVPQVVAFTAALAHAGKDGVAAVLIGNIADKLHDKHGLAHAGAAEKAYLAALGIGSEQIHHLDTCLQHIVRRHDVGEAGSVLVDGPVFLCLHLALAVYWLAHHVEHAPQGLFPHRHLNRHACSCHPAASGQAVGRTKGDAAHGASAQLLHHLCGDRAMAALQIHSIIDGGQLAHGETHVHHRAYNFANSSFFHFILHSAERWPRPQSRRSPWLS